VPLPEPDAKTALASVLELLQHSRYPEKWLRCRANILNMDRPRPLSVPDVATALQASDAYVRRLLIRGHLFGTKVGPVWAIYPEDLEAFRRLRRLPGRPRKAARPGGESETRLRIDSERSTAGTDRTLRKTGRNSERATSTGGLERGFDEVVRELEGERET
jgi:hypothetical protein